MSLLLLLWVSETLTKNSRSRNRALNKLSGGRWHLVAVFFFRCVFYSQNKNTNLPAEPSAKQPDSQLANRPARKLAIKPARANLFDFFPDRFLVFSSNSDYYYYVRVLLTHFFVKPEPLETMRRTEQKKQK